MEELADVEGALLPRAGAVNDLPREPFALPLRAERDDVVRRADADSLLAELEEGVRCPTPAAGRRLLDPGFRDGDDLLPLTPEGFPRAVRPTRTPTSFGGLLAASAGIRHDGCQLQHHEPSEKSTAYRQSARPLHTRSQLTTPALGNRRSMRVARWPLHPLGESAFHSPGTPRPSPHQTC